jgi:hypothetical protein
MPSDFDKPYRLFDISNNLKLTWTTREEYYNGAIASIADDNTGVPQNAMLYGTGAIAYTPTASFTLKAKSSSTADTAGTVVRIEGWLDSAKTILGYEDITITPGSPTTYATATTPLTFYGLTRVTKSTDTTGFITLANNSTVVLATIAPYDRQSRYVHLYFGLIPDDAYNYELLYKRKIKKLEDDNDYPFNSCEDFLILNSYGYALSQEKESVERAQQIWGKAQEVLHMLVRNSQGKSGPDFQHKFVSSGARSHRS